MTAPLELLSHRFRVPAETFSVTSEDGVSLAGSRLGRDAGERDAVILCHGFLGWHRKPRPARLAEDLSSWFSVYAFDFRGHGSSGGRSTFGDREVMDVAAVVARARRDGCGRVVTVGASMGGIAAIRHAALLGGVDAVVAISTPARWEGHGTGPVERMTRLISTAGGRRLTRLMGVRLAEGFGDPEEPEEVVGKIAPTPVVIIHGRDDHYFGEDEAWRLFRAAGEPKRLLLASRFGHAEDGFTHAFSERLRRVIERTLAEGSSVWSG